MKFHQSVISPAVAAFAALPLAGAGITTASAQTFVPPPAQFVVDPNGVDPKSNMFNYSETDAAIGADKGIELVRIIPTDKRLGYQQFGKWSFNLAGYVYETYDSSDDPDKYHHYGPTTIHAVVGNKSYTFRAEYASPWEPENPATAISVSSVSPNYAVTVTTETGEIWQFLDPAGGIDACTAASTQNAQIGCMTLSNIVRPDGERWDFSYETFGSANGARLKKVVSNAGYIALFEYNQTTNDMPSAVCLLNRSTAFVDNLTSCPTGSIKAVYGSGIVTKPNGETMSYGATTHSLVVWRGSASVAEFAFFSGPTGAVYARGTALDGSGGDRWNYAGDYADPCFMAQNCAYPSQNKREVITDPNAGQTIYDYRALYAGTTPFVDPLPSKTTNPLGYYAEYDYGLGSSGYLYGTLAVKSVKLPEGNLQNFTYDDRNNILSRTLKAKPGAGAADIVASASFPAGCTSPKICNKPASVTDARGAVTDYTYDGAHGGMLTESAPADANGVRAVKRYAYAQRYAWVKNAGGGFSQAATPIWVPTEMRTCRTTATVSGACAGGTSDEVVTSYDYGPDTGLVGNNLWLRGTVVTADGASLRTCFGYDTMGNRIWETKPRAGLSACY